VGSGLIYAGILVAWGVYFVPRWVRRHEEMSEARSVERFSQAMRILSRKPATADQRTIVMPPRPEAAPVVPRAAARRRGSLAVRRRRILAALLLTTLGTTVLTPLTAVPWWLPVAMVLATVADVVHLRIQARRLSDVTRSRKSVRRRVRSRWRRFDSVERINESRETLARERAAALAERLAAEAAADAAAQEEAARREADAAAWQPVPVPLPTYVSKPKAPERPAATLGEHEPFDQTVPPRRELPPLPVPPTLEQMDELDEIIERRRAVND